MSNGKADKKAFSNRFQLYLSCIVVVSFITEENRSSQRILPTLLTSLYNKVVLSTGVNGTYFCLLPVVVHISKGPSCMVFHIAYIDNVSNYKRQLAKQMAKSPSCTWGSEVHQFKLLMRDLIYLLIWRHHPLYLQQIP